PSSTRATGSGSTPRAAPTSNASSSARALRVAVGSTRAPKVEAVRRVLTTLAPVVAPLRGATVTALDLGSIAPAMPLTLQELLDGSRLRAFGALERMRAEGEPADL